VPAVRRAHAALKGVATTEDAMKFWDEAAVALREEVTK
jgi:hypothetical protein